MDFCADIFATFCRTRRLVCVRGFNKRAHPLDLYHLAVPVLAVQVNGIDIIFNREYRSRLYTLDVTGKVLEAQKQQSRALAIGAVLLSVLLLSLVLVLLISLRLGKEKKAADAVIEEAMEAIDRQEIPGQAGNNTDRLALTRRELEILPLVAEGLTNKQIAAKLYLTEQTIKWYRMRLNVKFQAKNATEVIAKAKERGII